MFNIDDSVKSHEFNYRWLSKKVHIQAVVFFSGSKAYIYYVEGLKKILQHSRWDFLRRHQNLGI